MLIETKDAGTQSGALLVKSQIRVEWRGGKLPHHMTHKDFYPEIGEGLLSLCFQLHVIITNLTTAVKRQA